jgi:hypothetical protein
VAISGRPQAEASRRVSGNPSRRDDSTAMWADAQKPAMSSTNPRCVRLRRSLHALISASGIEVGLAASGSPAINSRMSWPPEVRRSCAAMRGANPFVLDMPAREGDGDRAGGLGTGLKSVGVDPRSGNERDPSVDAKPFDLRPVVAVLHQYRRTRMVEQSAHEHSGDGTGDAGLAAVAKKARAKAGGGVETNDRQAKRRQRPDQRCLHGDVMREIWLESAVETANFVDNARQIARIEAAAPPVERMEQKTFGFNRGAMAVDAGGNMHLVSGVARGASHRQAMRDEVPILGDQVDEARSGRTPCPGLRARGDSRWGKLHPV